MSDEAIVLNTSDESAKFVTGIYGWVSRDGLFFGNDEKAARYHGCTHVICDCGKPVEKGWLKCVECRNKSDNEKFAKMPSKVWDMETPITLYDGDEYFFDNESLLDFCEDHQTTPNKLKLVLCKPVYAYEIDPDEFYADELAEDTMLDDVHGEFIDELVERFSILNKFIREHKIILSWQPSDVAVIIEQGASL